MPRKRPKPKTIQLSDDSVLDTTIKTEIKTESKNEPRPSSPVELIDLCSSPEDAKNVRRHCDKTMPQLTEYSRPHTISISDSSSPPELDPLASVDDLACSRRITRKSSRHSTCDSCASDVPPVIAYLKKKKQKPINEYFPKEKIESHKAVSSAISGKQSNSKSDNTTMPEKQLPDHHSYAKAATVTEPQGHIPKINIVHADNAKKAAKSSKKTNRLRNHEPSPIKFKIVLDNGNDINPQVGRGRPRKKPAKAKPILKDMTTQTKDKLINRKRDLCCKNCGKNFATGEPCSEDEIEILQSILDFLTSDQPQNQSIMPVQCNNPSLLPIMPVQDDKRATPEKKKSFKPMHKVPTTKPKELNNNVPIPQLLPLPNVGTSTKSPVEKPSSNFDENTNTEEVNMDVETDPLPPPPQLTFWHFMQGSPNVNQPHYGPHDIMRTDRPKPGMIPLGAVKAIPITKKEDVDRIGRFNDLYDNPLRPKLLDVEHPPEDPEKLKQFLIVGDIEPEIPDDDADINIDDFLPNISDSENEDEDGEAPKFSDDEEEEGDMSDTCSIAMDQEENELDNSVNFDESIVEEVTNNSYDEEFFMLDPEDMSDFGVVGKDEEIDKSPTPQKPPTAPSERIETEINKTLYKTPLELVDEELDYDEEDDIESPSFESIKSIVEPNEIVENTTTVPQDQLDKVSSNTQAALLSEVNMDESENMKPIDETPTDSLENENVNDETPADSLENENVNDETPADSLENKHVNDETVPDSLENEHVNDETPQISEKTKPIIPESSKKVLIRQTPALSVPVTIQTMLENNDHDAIVQALKACTDEFLSDFYNTCKINAEYFNKYFPIIAKQFGMRKMPENLYASIRTCELPGFDISSYKHIVHGLILAGFEKEFVLKYILQNQRVTTDEGKDLIIEIILEKNGVEQVMDPLEQFITERKYAFKYPALKCLLQQAIETDQQKWKNLVLEVLKCITKETKEEFYADNELKENTFKWLRNGIIKNHVQVTQDEPKVNTTSGNASWFKRTIVNTKVTKPVPELQKII